MAWSETTALVSLAALVYHYAVYPALLLLARAMRTRGREIWAQPDAAPEMISIVLSVYNEERRLAARVRNLIETAPAGSEIIVVSDGSNDDTDKIAQSFADKGVRLLRQEPRQGKGRAINAGVAAANGSIVLLTDANATFEPDAVHVLIDAFRDPSVGLASGSLKLASTVGQGDTDVVGAGEGAYWRYESLIRRLETELSATVSAVGPILAIRTSQWEPIPPHIINDDAFLALRTLHNRARVVYVPDAVCWRVPSQDLMLERERRARMAAGRYQLLASPRLWPWHAPELLWFWFSHKVLRVLSPLLMLGALVGTLAVLVTQGGDSAAFWWVLAAGQAVFYALAWAGQTGNASHGPLGRLTRLAALFLQVNWGASEGLVRFLLGRQTGLWQKTR